MPIAAYSCLLFVAVCGPLELEEPPTAEQLSERVVTKRKQIESGLIRLEIHDEPAATKVSQGETSIGVTRCYAAFEPGRIRCDFWHPNVVSPGESEEDWIIHKNIRTPQDRIFFSTEKSRGRPLAAAIHRGSSGGGAGNVVVDPRLLGLCVCSALVLHTCNFDDLLIQNQAKGVSQEHLNGYDCWKIDYDLESGGIAALWIAPSLGDSIIQGTIEVASGTERLTDSIECTIRHFTPSDVWFPEKVVFRRTVGETLKMAEEVVVTEFEANVTAPPDNFELAGMNIPRGTTVLQFPAVKPTQMWDGTKLTSVGGSKDFSAMSEPHRSAWFWSAVVLANIAVIALLLYWARIRSRPI